MVFGEAGRADEMTSSTGGTPGAGKKVRVGKTYIYIRIFSHSKPLKYPSPLRKLTNQLPGNFLINLQGVQEKDGGSLSFALHEKIS